MRSIKRLLILLFIVLLVPTGAIAIFCLAGSGDGADQLPDINEVAAPGQRYDVDAVDYRRGEERTWLTLPEWYVVYSADEYARFLETRAPTGFPFFSSIGQFWTTYCQMHHLTEDRYQVSTFLHARILAIGTSYTIEHAIQGVYEKTIGRLTQAIGGTDTVEDRHAHQVAREYADFLKQAPWYEFPFFRKIGGMWTQIDFSSADVFRRVERRAALTLGYTVRGLYGWLVRLARLGSRATSRSADQATLTVIEPVPPAPPRPRRGQVIKPVGKTAQLVALPRSSAFTPAILDIARDGTVIREIAGNDEILVTVIAPRGWTSQSINAVVLFSLPILTNLDQHRFALWVRVAALHDVVRSLEGGGVRIERVYDY